MHNPVVIRLDKAGKSSTVNAVMVSRTGKFPALAKVWVLTGDVSNVIVISGKRATLYNYKTRIPAKPAVSQHRVEIGLDEVIYLHPSEEG